MIGSTHPSVLFSRNNKLFKRVLKNVKIYGEYGCGKSTVWVLPSTNAQVFSVDTPTYWINEVCKDDVENNARLMIRHFDLGDVGDYGYPIDYSKSISLIYTQTFCEIKMRSQASWLLMVVSECVVF
jgi:hypothetical protein